MCSHLSLWNCVWLPIYKSVWNWFLKCDSLVGNFIKGKTLVWPLFEYCVNWSTLILKLENSSDWTSLTARVQETRRAQWVQQRPGKRFGLRRRGERAAGSGLLLPIQRLLGPFLNHQSQAHLDGAGAGRGGQQFKMLVLPSPDRPLLPGPRPEKKLEKVVGGSGENTLK